MIEAVFTEQDTLVSVKITAADGTVDSRHVSVEQFANALVGSQAEPTRIPITNVPATFHSGYVTTQPGTFGVVFTTPAQIQLVTLSGDHTHLYVPFPELCFAFTFSQGKLLSHACFAKRGEELCYYPFGNVYEGGSICWGGNDVLARTFTTLEDAESLLITFISAGTNDDLYRPSFTTQGFASSYALYRALEGMEEFPTDWLVPCGKSLATILDFV